MLNDENQEVDLETSTEEATEETQETQETQEEEQGVEYWKAEALKNKAILERNKNKEPKEEKKSDGFGYDVKAYLKASGIKADEFDFVKEELKRFGGDIDGLIDNDYFQAKLEKQRAIKQTAEATPTGKRTGNSATDSTDYWLNKPFAEVPKEMRRQVLIAKEKKEGSGSHFYNS
ncbi:MAG: hypothetical protein CO041_05935 [Candidatus Pacebacteria bacterium CG_4_9_14_0_2_um_filter_40_15]|nr:MAG: hypothetical protein CO041_05935 [Candidatus Pacebacteria bacterium CG_4_9_14_0_2_um_filter_40_15]